MPDRQRGADDVAITWQTLVATLHPAPSQTEIILETMTRSNRAANEVAALAYALGRAYHRELSAHLYDDLRRRYELPANLVLHAITKVIRRFHLDRSRQPWFPDHAGLFYQEGKTLRWRRPDQVSLSTHEGRLLLPARFERYQELSLPNFRRGNVGLAYEGSCFLLYHVVEVPVVPAPPLQSASVLRERFTAL